MQIVDGKKEEELQDDWTSVKYYITMLLTADQLLAEDFKISFKLSKEAELAGQAELLKEMEPSESDRRGAEVKLIDKRTFDLIQIIQDDQKSKKDKDAAHDELKHLDKLMD